MEEEERAKKEKCKRESPGILIGRAGRSSYINGSKRDERGARQRDTDRQTDDAMACLLSFTAQPGLGSVPGCDGGCAQRRSARPLLDLCLLAATHPFFATVGARGLDEGVRERCTFWR